MFSCGAAVALVPHCGVAWFSLKQVSASMVLKKLRGHIPQPWPATLELAVLALARIMCAYIHSQIA